MYRWLLTLLMLSLLVGASGISKPIHAPTHLPLESLMSYDTSTLPITATASLTATDQVPGGTLIRSYLRPVPASKATYTRHQLEQAAAVIQIRLGVLGLTEASVTLNAHDDILVTLPWSAATVPVLPVLTQPGLIEFFHISQATGPSFRFNLIGKRLTEPNPGSFAGDIFVAAVVEERRDNWTVVFDLKPEIADQRMTFAVAHPEDFFAVVVDEFVIGIIAAPSRYVPGLSEAQARTLAAFMLSGPLPLPLEHNRMEFVPSIPTMTPSNYTLAPSSTPPPSKTPMPASRR